jgi:hypothetical protein
VHVFAHSWCLVKGSRRENAVQDLEKASGFAFDVVETVDRDSEADRRLVDESPSKIKRGFGLWLRGLHHDVHPNQTQRRRNPTFKATTIMIEVVPSASR